MDTHEPKDGDFIAYIDQLQKESAERLLGSGHPLITQLDKKQPKNDGHFFAGRKPADLRSPAELRAALSTAAAPASVGRILRAMLAIVIGTLLALYWMFASVSVGFLLVGIALIVWGMQRINRVSRQFFPRHNEQARAQVSTVFNAPTKTK